MFVFGVPAPALFVPALVWAVPGVHALLPGRMPGHWGAATSAAAEALGSRSPTGAGELERSLASLLATGVGLVAVGHVVKPTR